VREPQVFLMDEPLSNLDAKLRVEARAMISRLHHRLETTFIYVTHDQVEAMTMGMRIAVLKDGILQQLDTPQNLYDKPDNVFVAGFIGSPAMNFFDATLVGTKEEMYVDGGTFRVKLPPGKAASVSDYLGQEVVFGVRPEDIHDRDHGRAADGRGRRDGVDGQRDLCLPVDGAEDLHSAGGPPHAGPDRAGSGRGDEHGQRASL
jgi:multiple sugar transport system ATP-binding protein